MDRLAQAREQERELAAIRKRQEEEARRQQEEFMRSSIHNAYSPGQMDPQIRDTVRYFNTAPSVGANIARGMGVKPPGVGSAYHLSRQMSRIGSRLYAGMAQESLQRFETAMANFDPAMMEGGLRSSAYAGYISRFEEVNRDFNARAERGEVKLPLGDKSAVEGVYADILSQIVEMRADGRISEPLARGMALMTAALQIREMFQQAKRVAKKEPVNVTPTAKLRQARQAALQPVEQKWQQQRIAAEQKRRRRQAAEREEAARLAAAQQRARTAKRTPTYNTPSNSYDALDAVNDILGAVLDGVNTYNRIQNGGSGSGFVPEKSSGCTPSPELHYTC